MAQPDGVPKAIIPPDPFGTTTEQMATATRTATQRSSLLSLGGELFEQFFQSVSDQLEENAGLNDEQNAELGSYLETKNVAILSKRDHVGDFLARLEAEADAIRAEEKRLAARRGLFEQIGACLRSAIYQQLLDAGITRIEGQLFSFSIRKNPPKVQIEDENAIPPEFIDWHPVIKRQAIKDALEEGKPVSGAALVTTTRLDIR